MNIEISPKEYERCMNWYDAMMYCQLLIIDNKNDWRLPTKKELYYIYNSENDFVDVYYWSSTESDTNNAWIQNLYGGNQFDYNKDGNIYVRAVRSI